MERVRGGRIEERGREGVRGGGRNITMREVYAHTPTGYMDPPPAPS